MSACRVCGRELEPRDHDLADGLCAHCRRAAEHAREERGHRIPLPHERRRPS